MQYTCKILDNILYSKIDTSNYKCLFRREGLKMRKYFYKNEEKIVKISASISFPSFKTYYEFLFLNTNENYTMTRHGLLKPIYKLNYNERLYEVYPHRGTKTSIYRDKKQIAYYKKNTLSTFTKESYNIFCDKSADIELILLFIASLNFSLDEDYSTVTIDLGNIGLEAKKFNDDWSPS